MTDRTLARTNWLILGCAIVCEVAGSLALKQAESQWAWLAFTLVADAVAFWMLALLLKRGMALSVAYGIWGALGVALTALLGAVLFREPFTVLMGCGVALVMAGVLLVEHGSEGAEPTDASSGERSVGDRTVPRDVV